MLPLEKSLKAKHINISVKYPSIVRVAIPKGVSLKRAVSFVNTKKKWIIRALQKSKANFEKRKHLGPVHMEHAEKYLLNRLKKLAVKYGFQYNKATIRNQKTRWGSCSEKNNISLNMQLMNLPRELMDYVILHELVHTKIKNHSPLFWHQLDKYVINSKLKNRKLKEFIL